MQGVGIQYSTDPRVASRMPPTRTLDSRQLHSPQLPTLPIIPVKSQSLVLSQYRVSCSLGPSRHTCARSRYVTALTSATWTCYAPGGMGIQCETRGGRRGDIPCKHFAIWQNINGRRAHTCSSCAHVYAGMDTFM